mgnify:CR=1 FL=1
MNLLYFLRLVRWPNLLIILFLHLLIAFQLPFVAFSDTLFWCMTGGTILIAGAGNIINDLLDYELDIVNKPARVIIHRFVSHQVAWNYYFGLNILALAAAVAIQNNFLIIVFLLAILLLGAYAFWLKKSLLLGNLVVSLLCAWILVNFWWLYYPALSVLWQSTLLFFASFAFGATWARELLKDLEDAKGDELYHAKTVPIVWGKNNTLLLTQIILFCVLVVLLVLALFLYTCTLYWAIAYTLLILIPSLLYLMLRIHKLSRLSVVAPTDYHVCSSYLKWYFLLGICCLFFI